MKQKRLIAIICFVSLLVFSVPIASASDLNDSFTPEQMQWFRDNQDKWWVREILMARDLRTDFLDLNFGTFLNDAVNYFIDSERYIDYKLNGTLTDNQPNFDSSLVTLQYATDLQAPLFVSYEYTSNIGTYLNTFKSPVRNDSIFGQFRYAFVSESSKVNHSIWGLFSDSNNHSLRFLTYLYNWNLDDKTTFYKLHYSPSSKLGFSFRANKDFNIDFISGNFDVVSFTVNGNDASIGDSVNVGDIIIVNIRYKSLDRFAIGSSSPGWISYNDYFDIVEYQSSIPNKPTPPANYNSNITNYTDTNNNFYNDMSKNQYELVNKICDSIDLDIDVNNNYINNVVDVDEKPNGGGYIGLLEDDNPLFNMPGDFLRSLKDALLEDYSPNFHFEIQPIYFKDQLLIPLVETDINPRDLLGNYWDFITYIIVTLLTVPWILWFVNVVRGGSDDE